MPGAPTSSLQPAGGIVRRPEPFILLASRFHRLTVSPSNPPRRAFTLLEAILASVIGMVLMLAGLGVITTLERTDRSLAVRADEAAQMQRMRLVFQRTFDSILVANRTSVPRTANAVATPVPGKATTPAGSNPTDTTNPTTPATDGPSSPTTPAISPTPTNASSRSSGRASNATEQPTDSKSAGTSTTAQLPADPSASRVLLSYDETVTQAMSGTPRAGLLGAVRPQRFEVVLTDSPVPALRQDPFVLARALAREERLSRRRDLSTQKPAETTTEEPQNPADPSLTVATEEEESEEPALRAVRGTFQLVTQVEKQPDEFGPLWELWWVPRFARRTPQEVREMGRVAAEVELAGTGEPYRIAQDIRALRFRVFDDREKKEVYSALLQTQLPAYAEVEVEMRSGRTAQWLFEISWATGPETREQAQRAQSTSPSGTTGTTPAGTPGPAGSGDSAAALQRARELRAKPQKHDPRKQPPK